MHRRNERRVRSPQLNRELSALERDLDRLSRTSSATPRANLSRPEMGRPLPVGASAGGVGRRTGQERRRAIPDNDWRSAVRNRPDNRGRVGRRPNMWETRADIYRSVAACVVLAALVFFCYTKGAYADFNEARHRVQPVEMVEEQHNPAQESYTVAEEVPVEAPPVVDSTINGCPITGNSFFPQSVKQWCEPIERYAREYNLDPFIEMATVMEETLGDPNAISSDQAVGLRQVVSNDNKAMCVNGPCFNTCDTNGIWATHLSCRPDRRWLLDVNNNLQYGSWMKRTLLNRTGGDEREALKLYGPDFRQYGYNYADAILTLSQRCRTSAEACTYISIYPVK